MFQIFSTNEENRKHWVQYKYSYNNCIIKAVTWIETVNGRRNVSGHMKERFREQLVHLGVRGTDNLSL